MSDKKAAMHAAQMVNRSRGFKQLRLGGRTHTLRFRAFEIAELEKQMKKPITQILEEQDFGLNFAITAVMVGTAHEYAGKTGKEARMSRQKVASWIDKVPDFAELIKELAEAVILGIPGAKDAMDDAQADAEEDDAPFEMESVIVNDDEDESTSSSTGTNGQSKPSVAASKSPSSGATPVTSVPATRSAS